MVALGEVARQAPLPLPVGAEDVDDQKVTLLGLVKTLVQIFNNKKLPSKVSCAVYTSSMKFLVVITVICLTHCYNILLQILKMRFIYFRFVNKQ